MGDNKHTPGPWHANHFDNGQSNVNPDNGKQIIKTRFDLYGMSPADANLIAAAPELLKLLVAAVENDCGFAWRDAAIAAIAKARGES